MNETELIGAVVAVAVIAGVAMAAGLGLWFWLDRKEEKLRAEMAAKESAREAKDSAKDSGKEKESAKTQSSVGSETGSATASATGTTGSETATEADLLQAALTDDDESQADLSESDQRTVRQPRAPSVLPTVPPPEQDARKGKPKRAPLTFQTKAEVTSIPVERYRPYLPDRSRMTPNPNTRRHVLRTIALQGGWLIDTNSQGTTDNFGERIPAYHYIPPRRPEDLPPELA